MQVNEAQDNCPNRRFQVSNIEIMSKKGVVLDIYQVFLL